MITSEFNHKTGILETTIVGETALSELTEYILALSKNDSLPKYLKIFTDASKAWYEENVTPEDMVKLAEANVISLAQRDYIFDAFVISSAMETAMGQLYKEFSQAENYEFNVFSTKKSAVEWLGNF